MSNAMTAPTRGEFKRLEECETLGEAFQSRGLLDRIKQSAPAHVKPSRMLRTFIQATSRTPKLLQCNMRSVLGAMLTCSEVGLEPNTPLQHAFLIPFEKSKWNPQTRTRESQGFEVQLIFGYPGLLDLAYRSGHVTSVHADVVWAGDEFSFCYGTDSHLRHVPMGRHEAGEVPIWAYAHAKLTHGHAFEVMPWQDVMRIRNGSQGFQSALRAKEQGEKAGRPYVPAAWTEAPWVKWEVPMAKKTVFRALWKWLPHSVELAGALALDEQQERGSVDFSGVLDGRTSIIEGGFEDGDPLIEDMDHGAAPRGAWEGVEAQHAASPPPARPNAPQTQPEPPKPRGRPRKQQAADEAPSWMDEAPPVTTSAPPDASPERKEQAPAPEVEEAPPSASGATFSAWLVDGEGRLLTDGNETPIKDPLEFARRYVEELEHAHPSERELMKRANMDAIAEACSHPGVMEIINPREPETALDLTPTKISPAQEIFMRLDQSIIACKTVEAVTSLGNSVDFVAAVKEMHGAEPALWGKLKKVADDRKRQLSLQAGE